MSVANHPFFFLLLKKLIIVTLKKRNTNKITGKDKEEISQISGISKSYCERILTGGVYHNTASQFSIGDATLNKLVRCLTDELGYESWDSFCEQERRQMKDHELLPNLSNKDYAELQNESYRTRIQNEIEQRAEEYIQQLISKTSTEKIKEDRLIVESSELQLDTPKEKEVEDVIPRQNQVQTLSNGESNNSSWTWIVVGFVTLVLIVVGAVFFLNGQLAVAAVAIDTLETRRAIEQVIRKAGKLEFSAYKAVPMDRACSDTIIYGQNYITPCLEKFRKSYMPYLDSLRDYMGKEPLAEIRDVVGSSVWKGWTIQNENNMSKRTLLSVEQITILKGDSIAYADTREEYLIEWFDIRLGEHVYYYGSPDKYRYTLKKDAFQKWKIEDIYDSTPSRIIRKAIICCKLQGNLVDVSTIRKYILTALDAGDLNLALMYIQCYYKHNDRKIPAKVNNTFIHLKYLHRDINIGAVHIEHFNEQKIELTKNFSTWFENYSLPELE